MHALNTFFHQGYDLMKELEPFMKSISEQVYCQVRVYNLCRLYVSQPLLYVMWVEVNHCEISKFWFLHDLQLEELNRQTYADQKSMLVEQERHQSMVC